MSSSLNLSNTLVHLVHQNQLVFDLRNSAEHIRTFKMSIGRNSFGICLVIGVERQVKCFEGDCCHILTKKNWLCCIKKIWRCKVEREEKRSDQSQMKFNVAHKSWIWDHRNRCETRPDIKYRNVSALFFWIFFHFRVVWVKVVGCDCYVNKQLC